MPAPNLFLIYVRDAEAATAFYSDLFEIEPTFTSPRYVAFETAGNTVAAPIGPAILSSGMTLGLAMTFGWLSGAHAATGDDGHEH